MSVKLRSKKLSDGSESFYLDIYLKGIRQYEFLGIKFKKNDADKKQKKELAEAKRSKRELELIANYHDLPKNFNGDDDFLEFYKSKCKNKSFKSTFLKFKEFSEKKTVYNRLPFKLINEKFCEDYKEYLLDDVKNSSAWLYLEKLKTVLNLAVKEKIIPSNPAKYVKIRLEGTERVYFTKDELIILANTECKENDIKRAFMFSCFTGLRISDINKLTWSQIKEKRLFVKQTKTKGIEYLPLSESALKYLYMDQDLENLSPDKKIFKLKSDMSTNRKLKEWVKEAKINKHISYHASRHTFATLSLSSGIDIYTVSKMMGHKSVKMTEIYAKIINKTVEEAVSKLPLI